ncbi:MAG: transcription termination factor Rho [Nocardioidaceae bacterium]|nr:transcription termination factor Rho [Nocardioidaceae bacterium]
MLLGELKQLASSLGITGTTSMRKGALVEAISARQSGSGAQPSRAGDSREQVNGTATDPGRTNELQERETQPRPVQASDDQSGNAQTTGRNEKSDDTIRGRGDTSNRQKSDGRTDTSRTDTSRGDTSRGDTSRSDTSRSDTSRGDTSRNDSNRTDTSRTDTSRNDNRGDDGRGGGRNSRRRSRNRDRDRSSNDRGNDRGNVREPSTRRDGNAEPDTHINDDDVLIPVAGILDLLDNYAFVRTSGYLPGPNDVYVSLSMVRKFSLRKGDAITGAVRQLRDGERREKFNPMVRLDTVNGAEPDAAAHRVEFSKLTPLYASERLRLETEPGLIATRLIDIVAPIGKGQRGLIVSPSKAGKTLIMQAIANAITTNNPECHLMVVLVDERPEEVTEMQRAVKGEVVASTFDRPADDHTTVAELAIERAKRLVELGHDVVVLLDSITRLGRAYNIAAPASGRILSGGVDSSALYPPKKFFGAARNIEDGGSLTILATALIETGSKMDEVIFEEFKGTGNMELRLRREFADKRIFPAIDVDASGTRREELLMSKDELQITWKLRRVLSALDGQQALELLLSKLRSTKTNIEFLMQVNKTTPTAQGLRDSDD